MLFEIKDIDRKCYEQEFKNRLPAKMIDCHTHVWTHSRKDEGEKTDQRLVTWPARVVAVNPIEDLQETYRLMFPDMQVTPLIFSGVTPIDMIEELNACSLDAAQKANVPSLLYVHPSWSPELLAERLISDKRQGIKVYLNNAPSYLPGDEVRIYDFLPPAHLEVVDRLGLIVMLHIPRSKRLRDPVNIAQILEIEKKYKDLHLILAHVGRAYCNEDVADSLEILSKTERLVFDLSANTNAWVFARTIEALGPKRLLFGSDLGITRMRMRRICEDGIYINVVPKGLYGDVSADKNMRETEGADADSLTFFLYEEIKSILGAADETGLSDSDLEDIFYNNARAFIEASGYTFTG
ncbi:MAG: amidohydrolase family protein [Spirochaetales bacterium]|jgi:uncharacterized protein|nr:amidohydrolase family protein [Spirochaetales bacterium]